MLCLYAFGCKNTKNDIGYCKILHKLVLIKCMQHTIIKQILLRDKNFTFSFNYFLNLIDKNNRHIIFIPEQTDYIQV